MLSSGLQARMVHLFIATIAGCVVGASVIAIGYYWIAYAAGPNALREFVVVYRQHETVDSTNVDGRTIDRRSYSSEALPETSRIALVLPPLLVNNFVIGAILIFFAIRYSVHFAGPVYRMSTDIRRVLAGETNVRISLRRGDEMRELAQRVNALLEALELAEARARE